MKNRLSLNSEVNRGLLKGRIIAFGTKDHNGVISICSKSQSLRRKSSAYVLVRDDRLKEDIWVKYAYLV